jgi:hypothetical protein
MSIWDDLAVGVIASGKRALARAGKSIAEDLKEGIEAIEKDLTQPAAKPEKVQVDVINVEKKEG